MEKENKQKKEEEQNKIEMQSKPKEQKKENDPILEDDIPNFDDVDDTESQEEVVGNLLNILGTEVHKIKSMKHNPNEIIQVVENYIDIEQKINERFNFFLESFEGITVENGKIKRMKKKRDIKKYDFNIDYYIELNEVIEENEESKDNEENTISVMQLFGKLKSYITKKKIECIICGKSNKSTKVINDCICVIKLDELLCRILKVDEETEIDEQSLISEVKKSLEDETNMSLITFDQLPDVIKKYQNQLYLLECRTYEPEYLLSKIKRYIKIECQIQKKNIVQNSGQSKYKEKQNIIYSGDEILIEIFNEYLNEDQQKDIQNVNWLDDSLLKKLVNQLFIDIPEFNRDEWKYQKDKKKKEENKKV